MGKPFTSAALAFALAANAYPIAPALSAGVTNEARSLPRRATLGVGLAPDPAGVRVTDIALAPAAQAFGLQKGDVIVGLDGAPVRSPTELATKIGRFPGGRRVALDIVRGDAHRTIKGRLEARPVEAFPGAVVTLGAAPFENGLLRDIMVAPAGGAKGPVVFLVQGYTCATVETGGPDTSHARLISGFLAKGIATYRIEKPQVGDSRGGPDCRDIGFKKEVEAFEAGYRALRETYGIAPERIFILGHSLGGLEAPILASRGPTPRGVAVYGTVLRNWFDYMIDIVKVQPVMRSGEDPAERERIGEELRPVLEQIMIHGQSPASVARTYPQLADLMRSELEWDGGEHLYGRHFSYWHEISATRLAAMWKNASAPVLSVYGESDLEAIDGEDHRLIADLVNLYRPGSARFVSVPLTGHGMRLDGTREEVRERARSGEEAQRPFNDALVGIFSDWISETMRNPLTPRKD